jgi:hypothetical protein
MDSGSVARSGTRIVGLNKLQAGIRVLRSQRVPLPSRIVFTGVGASETGRACAAEAIGGA